MLFPIVGSHFVPPAKALLEHAPNGAAVLVRPERDNAYDGNAALVLLDFNSIPESQHEELALKLAGYGYSIEDCVGQTFQLGHIAASGGKPISKIELATGLTLSGTIELAALGGEGWEELSGTLVFGGGGEPIVEIAGDGE